MTDGNIAIIGPRTSGKTTYLGALASYAQSHHYKGREFKVTPKSPEAKSLRDEAQNIFRQSMDFRPTIVGEKTVYEFPFYSFIIEHKPNRFSDNQRIELTTKDYPGEIFKELEKGTYLGDKHQEFVKDCFTNKMGCVIFISDFELGEDNRHYKMLGNFLTLMDSSNVDSFYKIAVVMSKCERGEIWTGRLEPERDLFKVHFPTTQELLRERLGKSHQKLKFFALSTFGVIARTDPRPNREDRITGKMSVVRYPDKWQPYNLIEPLIWISQTS